jgi:hypothetical protein
MVVWINRDFLPPRRASTVAKVISNLPVPRTARVVEFKDEWGGVTGDGGVQIVLELDSIEFKRVYSKSSENGYVAIEHAGGDSTFIDNLLGYPITEGRFRLERQGHGSYEIVILDPPRRRLYIFLSVQ